ncbi:hypothetical protein [Burkholderia sp. PR2]|uniref:hypothetical protein n=1 Tax=Burkholderia sp. PR2 TaxID=3448078 RepID=UPI00402ADF63
MHGQSDLAVAALDEHAPTPPTIQKRLRISESSTRRIAMPRISAAPKKIARASEEARAKPSPYEDRRRGHRDPRAARVVIGYASARSAGI